MSPTQGRARFMNARIPMRLHSSQRHPLSLLLRKFSMVTIPHMREDIASSDPLVIMPTTMLLQASASSTTLHWLLKSHSMHHTTRSAFASSIGISITVMALNLCSTKTSVCSMCPSIEATTSPSTLRNKNRLVSTSAKVRVVVTM